jgi:uncharacterized protein (TIGR04222 family)
MIEIIKLIPFSQIPWPAFLIYYIGLVIGCIILGWLFVNADGSTAYPLPNLTRFKPLDIAALRGGWTAVIRTVVFSLWRRNLINIEGEKRDTEIESVSSKKSVLSPVEKLIYQSAQTQTQTRDLLKDAGLSSQVERHLEPLYIEFEDLHLIRTHRDQLRAWITALALSLVIIAVGGAKVYLKIFHNRPFVSLIIIVIASTIALISILKPGKMAPTRLGRRYLKELKENFCWVQESLKSGKTPEGIDPAFSIAIFGVGALAGVSAYSHFTQAFPAAKSGGCGGGCGGCGG